jgi:type IV pilus assembly protein PilY1
MNLVRLLRTSSAALALGALLVGAPVAVATTPLADQPVFSNTAVPGNVALALSVEWPTVSRAAHPSGTYASTTIYRGYFDHNKCYRYVHVATETATEVSHFEPVGTTTDRTCPATGTTGEWSGNFLNWATMIAIDPFRWALTGGLRRVDTEGTTILERARHTGQGSLFPNRTITGTTLISGATPFTWGELRVRTTGAGTRLVFSSTGNVGSTAPDSAVQYQQAVPVVAATVYQLQVRVKVCVPGFLEDNCRAYSATNFKPEGLIQQYSNRMRYSAFGYLNDPSMLRDGGVLRARQKFVGPTMPVPGAPDVANPALEWSASTGIFVTNPDNLDAAATATEFTTPIANSGVINYLNKFGQLTTNNHKDFDPVSELFYAVTRYFRNLGNVPAWTSMSGVSDANRARFADGFPIITNWVDPIQYSCQRNFALGIGDIYTHRDKNLPGTGTGTVDEPTKPAQVSGDTVDSVTYTTKAFALQGLATPDVNSYSGRNNSAGMVGLAYHANTTDLRADIAGKQTMSTYWVDVLEAPFVNNNQFLLAAKFGGFKVPDSFDPLAATSIDDDWWYTTTRVSGTHRLPDNYFTAGQPDQMIDGLQRAFKKISDDLRAFTTSFATALPQTALLGTTSYGARYDASDWSGEVVANSVSFDAATGTPSLTLEWSFSAKLTGQIAEDSGAGWNTRRNIVTWSLTTGATSGSGPVGTAIPFRHASLSDTQKSALNTLYRDGDDSADYLNYLRGDRTHEESSTASGSAKIYRNRSNPVGDIVGSRVRPVGPPAAPFASATNPGYASFKTTWAARPTVVYVGTNAGIVHAINGTTTGGSAGREMFAYVPDMLFQGPSGTPHVSGLAARGDPDFSHKAMADGSPASFDVDFSRTQNNTRTGLVGGSNDWRTILIGGMGKGGRGYYALDITNPAAMTTEALVAAKVLWEISSAHPDFAELGFTYGEPTAVKTRKWGWVLIFASGYNNSDGKGWFFIVNPRNGALLEKISTGAGSTSAQAGMAHVQSYIVDRTDGTADAVYAGDLLGNLWRWDLRATTGDYPAPVKLAELTNATGQAQSVTSRPLVVVHPATNRRYVTVGTGRLLDNSDITSSVAQSFYAVIDGTANTFATTGPAGAAFPVVRTQLVEHTDLTNRVVVDTATKGGWWVNLGVAAAGNGWRVITEPSAFYGVVTFVAMLPNTSACNPSGISRVFSVDVDSGQSQLINDSGTTIAYSEALSGVVIEHRTYSVESRPRLVACNDLGTCQGLRRRDPGAVGLRRLNWRELPLAD